ncbi:MAG: LysE family transporter [Dehalococcoidales bacterium]|nr:LysE family transporter [Dehalococcoidales bacterium]MDP7525473.1 LysE family transporter [Dehalococcoidales bacterium]
MLPLLAGVVVITLSGVMMPGPMFAVTVAKSYRSPWAGVRISLGHALVEVPLILLIYFGFARFFEDNTVQLVLNLLGGAMIIWMGIAMFRARAEVVQKGNDSPYSTLVAGIITTGFNPYFLLWWATIGIMLVMNFMGFGIGGLALLIIVHWLCDLVWLSFVSILVYRTHSLWGLKFQEWLFITISLLLIGFGGWFLISGIRLVP